MVKSTEHFKNTEPSLKIKIKIKIKSRSLKEIIRRQEIKRHIVLSKLIQILEIVRMKLMERLMRTIYGG